jgi:hypothetical protein
MMSLDSRLGRERKARIASIIPAIQERPGQKHTDVEKRVATSSIPAMRSWEGAM